MNHDEWATSSDTLAMIHFVREKGGARKFRLFAVACARDELASGSNPEVEKELIPQYAAEIKRTEALVEEGKEIEYGEHWVTDSVRGDREFEIALAALGFDLDVGGLWTSGNVEETVALFTAAYSTHPAHYLRDIFGFVYRSEPLNSEWRTQDVVTAAESAYENRKMPIGHLDQDDLFVVADCLQEAECNDATLLSHLRSPGPHVQGCWVLDLLRAKD